MAELRIDISNVEINGVKMTGFNVALMELGLKHLTQKEITISGDSIIIIGDENELLNLQKIMNDYFAELATLISTKLSGAQIS